MHYELEVNLLELSEDLDPPPPPADQWSKHATSLVDAACRTLCRGWRT